MHSIMLGANKDVGVHQWFTGSVLHIRFSQSKSENKFEIHGVHTHTILLLLSILSIVFDRSIESNGIEARMRLTFPKMIRTFSHLRENIKVFEIQIVRNDLTFTDHIHLEMCFA